MVKFAMLAFYHRMNPACGFRWWIYGITAFMVASYIALLVVVLANEHCFPTDNSICLINVGTTQAVLNCVYDAVLIILPIPTIRALNVPRREKLTIYAILAIGSAYVIHFLINSVLQVSL